MAAPYGFIMQTYPSWSVGATPGSRRQRRAPSWSASWTPSSTTSPAVAPPLLSRVDATKASDRRTVSVYVSSRPPT
eukprot:7379679-Prymnesium_polylepis.1